MSRKRIEIMAIGEKIIYSLGAVEVTEDGDFYLFIKYEGSPSKFSRHKSGTLIVENEVIGRLLIRKGEPIESFRGVEHIATVATGLGVLDTSFTEYEMKQCDGIFCIDMRMYERSAFNLLVYMLNKGSIRNFLETALQFSKQQYYLYPGSYPLIGMVAVDAHPS